MVKERQDITGSNCLKGVTGKMIVNEKGIKDSWKEYMEKPMNEENEWDHRISAGVKEGPADCIRIDEIAVALKKIKRQSPRIVRASSRNDTSHRGYWHSVDIEVVKEGCISEGMSRNTAPHTPSARCGHRARHETPRRAHCVKRNTAPTAHRTHRAHRHGVVERGVVSHYQYE